MSLDSIFLPKVNSWFHRFQELILPNFCPNPRNPREKDWHMLDVRHALRQYISRTASFRQTKALLVSFHLASMGRKVSFATVGRWIKAAISLAYDIQARPVLLRIFAHSTHSAAIMAAWASNASLLDICQAATWTSPSSFIHNYRVDSYASADVAFGHRVLQQVATVQDPGSSQPPAMTVELGYIPK